MGFNLSPVVDVKEIDLTGIVQAVATTQAAIVGPATKGIAWKRMPITNDADLIDVFGTPTDENAKTFFSALGYLNEGRNLWFTRITDATSTVAGLSVKTTSGNTAVTQELGATLSIPGTSGTGYDPDEKDTIDYTSQDTTFYATGPGTYYNSIEIATITAADYAELTNPATSQAMLDDERAQPFMNSFDIGPQEADEFGVYFVVKDANGVYVVLEKYVVSTIVGKKDGNGENMHIDSKINNNSSVIRSRTQLGIEVPATTLATAMSGGTDVAATEDEFIFGWNLYKKQEEVDVSLLIDADSTTTVKQHITTNIAEYRKDCIAILDIPMSQFSDTSDQATVTNCINYVDSTLNLNTSYGAIYANHFKVYDKYNDSYRWVPCSGFMAGIFARTDFASDAWFPAAGLNRGVVNGISAVKFNPDLGERDLLYPKRINPIVDFRGEGVTVWGQKSLLNKNSAFNRINVRRLFIVLEKSIATAAKQVIFEINDSFTQNLFTGVVNGFLQNVQNRRGIYEFRVVCDETNNTGPVIDANEFVADIYIKPARSAEYIKLNFFATRTDQSFDELVVS